MRLLRQVQRHTIAAAASVALLTPSLTFLIGQGLLGDLVPTGTPFQSAAVLALLLTFVLFVPLGLILDWFVNRTRIPAAVAPLAVAILFAAFWLGVELAYRQLRPSFIAFYVTAGLMVAVAFCAYWIPLRFLRTRIPV
jgi:hypothetical protein